MQRPSETVYEVDLVVKNLKKSENSAVQQSEANRTTLQCSATALDGHHEGVLQLELSKGSQKLEIMIRRNDNVVKVVTHGDGSLHGVR